MAAAALEQAETPPNLELSFLTVDVEAVLDREKLSALPAVLFKRAMRLVAGVLGASLSSEQTDLLLTGVAEQEKGSVTAEGGDVVIEWDKERVHARQLALTVPFRSPLTAPGETISEEFGWTLQADNGTYAGNRPIRAALETAVDLERVKGPLHFRTSQPGDSMQPYGFEGTRKLSDLLSEAKLTKAARARLPIICDMVGPLWAPGVCLDSRAAPTNGTSRVLNLRFGPSELEPKA
jgi:tRNA(Ile)-lysidine synthase